MDRTLRVPGGAIRAQTPGQGLHGSGVRPRPPLCMKGHFYIDLCLLRQGHSPGATVQGKNGIFFLIDPNQYFVNMEPHLTTDPLPIPGVPRRVNIYL